MRGTGFYFLLAAVISALVGMGWGIQMSITGDHTLSPAHGHLNLIGWVTMAMFGVYYTLTPQADGPLARLHLGLTVLTVILIVPGITMAIRETSETLAKIGSLLALLSMLIFLYTVIRNGFGRRAGA